MPLYDYDLDRKFNSVGSRVFGCLFFVFFIMIMVMTIGTFGQVDSYSIEKVSYKTNEELAELYRTIYKPTELR